MLVDKQTYFENHHHKKDFTEKITFSYSAFVANVSIFLLISVLFINPERSDLLTIFLVFYI